MNISRTIPARPALENLEERLMLAAWDGDTIISHEPAGHTAIAVDGQGNPHLAWYRSSSGDLMVGDNGGSWTINAVETGNDVGQYVDMAVDALGQTHLVYYDASGKDLIYKVRQGSMSFWNTSVVASAGDVGRYSNLAVDSNNRPHVVFYNATAGTLEYAYHNGGSWQPSQVIATIGAVDADVYRLASIAVRTSGRPVVSFYQGGQLKYATLGEGGGWSVQTIAAAGDAGKDSAIVLDGQGRPHISFYQELADRGQLGYAYHNGTAWVVQALHAPAAGTYRGSHSAMAIGPSGQIGISYWDQTSQELRFARFNGSAWILNRVDDDVNEAPHSDVAFDPLGSARVSYVLANDLVEQVKMSSMSDPDIALMMGAPSDSALQSQDSFNLPITLTNVGGRPAAGEVTLMLAISTNILADGDPILLSNAYTVDLEVGESRSFTLSPRIGGGLASGSYYLISELQSIIEDREDGNQTVVSDPISVTQVAISESFGTIDGQKIIKKLPDASGRLVTFSLTGGGWGEIYGDHQFDEIVLHGTGPKSVLKITTLRGYETSVGQIVVEGRMGGIVAPTTDLIGGLTVQQGVKSIRMDDLRASSTIVLNSLNQALADPRLKVSLVFDEAEDGVSLTSQKLPIKILSATNWGGPASRITAPSMGKFVVRGGNAGGAMDLTGDASSLVLGSAAIRGNLASADWELAGNVGAIRVLGSGSGSIDATGSLKSLTAYRWTTGALEADSLGSIKMTGQRGGVSGDFGPSLTLHAQRLAAGKRTFGSIKISDDLTSPSWSIAGDGGTISVADVAQNWVLEGLRSLKSLSAVSMVNVSVTVDNLLSSLQAVKWTNGNLNVGSIGKLRIKGDPRKGVAGDLDAVQVSVSGSGVLEGRRAMTSLYVRDTVRASDIRITGHAGTVDVGRLDGSDILLGATGLTNHASDFGASRFRLNALKIRGVVDGGQTHFIDAGLVGAWTVGSLRLVSANPAGMTGTIQYVDAPATYAFAASPLLNVWDLEQP